MISIDDIHDDTFYDQLVVISVNYLLLWNVPFSVAYIDSCFTKKFSLTLRSVILLRLIFYGCVKVKRAGTEYTTKTIEYWSLFHLNNFMTSQGTPLTCVDVVIIFTGSSFVIISVCKC